MLTLSKNSGKKLRKMTLGFDLSIKATGMAINIEGKVVDFYKFKLVANGYKVIRNHEEIDSIEIPKQYIKSSPLRGMYVGKYIHEILLKLELGQYDVARSIIEAPSYESVGKHYNIAEFCGVVKSYIQRINPYTLEVPPKKLKKMATGHHDASKDDMCYALKKKFRIDSRGDDDIADACFLSLLF